MRSCVFVKATCREMRDFELGRTREQMQNRLVESEVRDAISLHEYAAYPTLAGPYSR